MSNIVILSRAPFNLWYFRFGSFQNCLLNERVSPHIFKQSNTLSCYVCNELSRPTETTLPWVHFWKKSCYANVLNFGNFRKVLTIVLWLILNETVQGKEINLWERQSRKIISSSFGVRHRNISWYSGYKIFFVKNLILNLKFSNYFGILLIHFRPMFDLCRNQVVGFY